MAETQVDQGYSWVILCVATIQNMLESGMVISLAVYMVDWTEYFQCTKAQAGSAASIFSGTIFFTGLFIGPIINKFGCRLTTVIGTIISVTGLLTTVFATSIEWIYISYSIVAGIGTGLSVLPPVIIVQYYFDKKRILASGISLTGHSIGAFLISPLLRFLTQIYGWRGTILIHCAINMHRFVTSSLFRPPNIEILKKKHGDDTKNIKNINGQKNKIHVCSFRICTFLKSQWDFKLLKEVMFLCYLTGIVFSMLSADLMYKFVPMKAIAMGLGKVNASLFPPILAFCSTVARLFVSFIANLGCVNITILCGMAILCGGLVTFLSTFIWNFNSLALVVGLFGLCLGTQVTLGTTLLTNLIGVARLAHGQSFLMGANGIVSAISLTLAGYMIDQTESFDLPFYIYGSLTVIGGLIMLSIPVIQKTRSKDRQLPKDTHTNGIEKVQGPYLITYLDSADVNGSHL